MKIIISGAGAWGCALALSAARHPAGHAVTLWARDASQAERMRAERRNARYLPGLPFPPALTLASGDLAALWPGADLVIVATPMAALSSMLLALHGCTAPVAWLCKGFEAATGAESGGLLAHEVQALVAPQLLAGAFSGPSFAQEVALGQPTALVAASPHGRVRAGLGGGVGGRSFAQEVAVGQPTALVAASPHGRVRAALVGALHSPSLRVYANEDIVGVEVGGAVKNVLAIATGLCDGLALGL